MAAIPPFEQLTLSQLRARTSEKWRAYSPEVLPLWVAEMDTLLAPEVVAAVTDALVTGDTGYASGTTYQTAFALFAAARWGWQPDPEAIVTVADVMTGVRQSLLAATEPGDPVIVPSPVYPPFFYVAKALGRQVRAVPLTASHRLDLPAMADEMRRLPGGRRAAVLLCNPHNPTGTVHTRAELSELAGLAEAHGVTVVSDEIHAPLVPEGTAFVPYLAVPGSATALTITSASKSFNLAGLKAALVVPGERAGGLLAQFGAEVKYGASHLGVLSHTAALSRGDEWLDAVRRNIADNRAYFARALARAIPAARCAPGPATYLVWVDGTDLGLGDDPAHEFLVQGQVAVSSGPTFGVGGSGHFRVNVATSREILDEAISRMAAVVARAG